MLAIIGGSGLTQLANLEVLRREVVRTPYGEPSGALTFGRLCANPVVFLARHGYGHTIPPHRVNYQANLWALQQAHVTSIISVASVGGIRADLGPGALVVPDQIIDYTWGRKSTFFEGGDAPVVHVDFTEPYDAGVRQRILAAAVAAGEAVSDGGVYAATQGPRLETAAEINRLERDGADVVGMTGMPEAVLARELGIPYAAINVVANYAAGRAGSANGICFDSIEQVLLGAMGRVRRVLDHLCDA
ncbi:MAG TPA: S-methyl-5'-thioinosine phosphorylase [Zoogloea sp.]|uniref:S-methyl-5'-thioinosine phosphorylase n=1 Tax=Zoogloea sp. TaxID=49181 RepID=UPI002C23E322|nr:S-methyl-5'-thioinosine phosphorylase [Zoogloea sp.]HMV18922.1 S-methyl-5'-thioinosine phosphorylase [Rhodocyclaceae bacterium]HMV63037.1 S-methyl-5'-thioinosine phosphorylase [Rhodocyclaceae bacterium]HMW52998.1 S-methyl-5'-thioinosine phosphorylase [Rhodocyclaceae bacterium]HMY48908.1 S-methyl-5'-thioinosine phosphorylase [Rhodocyclaceae bacterium]HMZ77355.1 S-methyl-5'-thioinosine phosphorylase [Rhodocyclaceae bacterium]